MTAPVVQGRKLAWVRDRVPDGGWPEHLHAARLLGTDPPPATSGNTDLVPEILDQGQLGSCVAHGTVAAARGEMIRASGGVPALGSRLWIYFLARAYDHDTANDDGTQIHNAFQAIARYGLPAELVWPYSDNSAPGAPFSQMPSPDAWAAALDAKFSFTMHRIVSTGSARIDDVKRALSARKLVVFGTDVSEAFCAGQFDPTVPLDPPGPNDKIAGGHCRFWAADTGKGFKAGNSWSRGWGDGGYSIDSYDYAMWSNTDDLWIFDSAPKALGGAS